MSEQASGSTTEKPKEKVRLDLIDGLRGFAILYVVLFHFWQNSWVEFELVLHIPRSITLYPFYATGYMGVDLFFFLSGFCLFYGFVRHKIDKTPMPTWKEFYWRRFLKIYPSYILAMLFFMFFGPMRPSLGQTFYQWLVHLLGLHTFFGDAYYTFHPVLWSLSIELQFYMLFPLVCLAFLRRPLLGYLGMVAITLGYRWWVMTTMANADDFTQWMNRLPGTLDLFAGGMLSAYVVVWARSRFAPTWQRTLIGSLLFIAGLVGYYLVIRGVMTIPNETNGLEHWQIRTRFLLSLSFVVTTIGGVLAWRPLQLAIANPILIFFADISYNWFLWHNYIGVGLKTLIISKYVATEEAFYNLPDIQKLYYTFASLGLSILLAMVITYGFERPFMKYGIRPIFARLFGWLNHPAIPRFEGARKLWARILPPDRLPVMEAVRGLGVLHIVVYQLWQLTWIYLTETMKIPVDLNTFSRTGFFGVNTLFLVAGFDWYYRFARSRYEGTAAPTWREFYLRQALTILPLYVVAVFLCLFTMPRVFLPQFLTQEIVTHLFFVQDFSIVTATALHPLFFAMAISVQFLVLFPLFVLAFRRSPLATFLVMTGIAWGYRWWLAHSGQPSQVEYMFLLYRLPAALDLFALGMGGGTVLAFLQARPVTKQVDWEPYLHAGLAGVALITYFNLLGGIDHLPRGVKFALENWLGKASFPLGLALVIVIVSGTLAWRPVYRFLSNAVFAGIGLIAYPFFLFTWLIAHKLIEWRIPYYTGEDPARIDVWKGPYFLLALGVSFIVAALLTLVVQRPLQHFGSWLLARRHAPKPETSPDALRQVADSGS